MPPPTMASRPALSGEPYIVHPLEVAIILADMKMDLSPPYRPAPRHGRGHRRHRGRNPQGVRRGDRPLRRRRHQAQQAGLYTAEERQAESLRKMLLAMVKDIRVIIVKLADRLHNMRTLASCRREKQERIARETLEIYAPIAHRLGMGKIRGELEDLAFATSSRTPHRDLLQEIESRRHANEEFLDEIQRHRRGRSCGAKASRPGRGPRQAAYSIFQKMKRQKIALDQVYDLLALRIITDSVKNCYAALGVIHNEWPPIPGRIKDFIAIPRPNLYQSLHTSVIGPGGHTFEVQIRTEEMHRIAEEGIAAHWKYKEGRKGPAEDDQRIAWLRQLVEWQRDMRDPGEFMSTLKVDLYPEEVYCFTPRGKVIVLPRDATPIDFAYAIHSDVGHTCVGAKVNGRIVPLATAAQRRHRRDPDPARPHAQQGLAGARQDLPRPQQDQARHQRHRARQGHRDRRKVPRKEARRLGVPLGKVARADLERVAAEYGYSKMEDLHAALGYGRFSARQVLQKLAPPEILEGRRRACPSRAPPAARPGAARGRRPRHQGQGRRRPDGLPRQVLQPDPRRSHRRLRHARQRRRRALRQLP